METVTTELDDNQKPVPESFEDFSPGWCEWALKEGKAIGPNVKVENVNVKRLSDDDTGLADGGGLTDALILRLEISYTGETNGNEPSTVIAKWFHKLTMNVALKWRLLFRMFGETFGSGMEEEVYRCDIKFYREALPLIEKDFHHPKVYYTGIVDKGNRNFWNGTIKNKPCKVKTITLMEDMKGWTSMNFGQVFLKGGLDPVDKELCLKNIAVQHARFWGEKVEAVKHAFPKTAMCERQYRGASHSWMHAKYRNSKVSSIKSLAKLVASMKKEWEGHTYMTVKSEIKMPSWFTAEPLEDKTYPIFKDAAVLEMLETFIQRYPAFNKAVAMDFIKKPNQTLLHGDFHAGNHMYGVDENKGKIVCFDFQCVGLGMVTSDVVTFLGYQGIVSDFFTMAKAYHEALLENGVENYSWDEFKKDMILSFYELGLKGIMDLNSMPPSKLDEIMGIAGDKKKDFLQILECGAFGWHLIILTDFYLQNKEAFLDVNSYFDIGKI